MAAKKRTATKKAVAKRSTMRARVSRVGAGLARVERDLPETLREFSDRVRKRLAHLERAVVRAETRYQREAVRALRVASHQLGRFEAEGERRWKKLTAQARREAIQVLRRIEGALERESGAVRRPTKKAARARRATRSRAGAGGALASAQL